jgi:hypothetical protein
MADEPEVPELALVESHRSSSSDDDETVKGDRDEDHIADSLDEEPQSPTTPVPASGQSIVAHRYRDLVGSEHEAASEDGSTTEAIPRLGESPLGSMLSIPDDTPSLQVRH